MGNPIFEFRSLLYANELFSGSSFNSFCSYNSNAVGSNAVNSNDWFVYNFNRSSFYSVSSFFSLLAVTAREKRYTEYNSK